MQLNRLTSTWTALSATRSRLAKRDLIAAVLRDADAAEVETVVSYLSGSLRQRRTGVGWRLLQQLPPAAPEAALTVAEVDEAFAALAELSGPGSSGLRAAGVQALFARATADEQAFLRGLVLGDLRQGALESQVQEGLAAAYGVPVAAVRRAAMLSSSTPAAAVALQAGGLAALQQIGLRVGVGVQPMLAASASDPAAAAERTGLPALVDAKLDGVRVQVHRDGDQVRVFTRSLDDITDRLPEVVGVARSLATDRVVLDGEVLALRPDGAPEAFQVVASRTMSGADEAAATPPLRVFVFDLLHIDGRDLLDEPLTARLTAMEQLLPVELLVPRRRCDTTEEVASAFADAVGRGFEGIVVKNLDAPYAAGRRDAAWVKVKPRHTFDLVVTAAEWGHGRRQGWLSNLHLAARDPTGGGLVMLGKTFKGLTDELLGWQTEQLLRREVRRTAGTVYVEPSLVVEIACDGLQASTRYPGGVALRFARVLRYRGDKAAEEADTIETVRALAGPLF
ncbi:ATP-dependent DNA ligase [uncultured Friedmanniella sp.]|uniref:ATP-dependent DNA ligase n=1 Tax=uncultured Friedmanniella sp. TaxID=335381 RepID=UPI0035C9E5F5